MRKIIVAICGMLAVGRALASPPNRYREPLKSDVAEKWLNGYKGTYSMPLTSTYSDLAKQLDDKSKSMHEHNGTYDDEGAVILFVARDITEHGALVCATQIQAANQNGRQYTWFDYYWPDDWACKWICETGYSGVGCSDTSLKCPLPIRGLPFSSGKSVMSSSVPQITSIKETKDKYIHTTEMEVLDYKNEEAGKSDVDVRQSYHIVLGIVEQIDYGVYLAPIKIMGQRGKTGFGISSWINSVYAANGQRTLLCKDGYIPNNTKNGCVKNPACDGTESYPSCNGFSTGFDESKHEEYTDTVNKCKAYRCIEDNYGFKSNDNHECILCDIDIKKGINRNGVCEKCATSQCFNASSGQCGGCTIIPKRQIERGKKYDSDVNRECWTKPSTAKFWGCVMCPDENKCYIKNNDGTYACGDCPTQ